jgi:biopolymer transport protein ExbB
MTIMDDALASAVPGGTDISSVSVLQHFVLDGGWITWFILIPLSVVTMALVFHYVLVIRRGTLAPTGLARMLMSAARQGQSRGILEVTRDDDTMLGVAAYAGMSQLPAGRESARAAIDEAVEERATKLFRRIEYLNVIGSVSPMIGLFGTVVGMIGAFNRIFAAGGGMPEPGKLAGDIAVALVTTFWGLLIAIPALSVHALFRNRIDTFSAECVKLCESLMAVVTSEGEAAAAPAAARAAAPAVPPAVSGARV